LGITGFSHSSLLEQIIATQIAHEKHTQPHYHFIFPQTEIPKWQNKYHNTVGLINLQEHKVLYPFYEIEDAN